MPRLLPAPGCSRSPCRCWPRLPFSHPFSGLAAPPATILSSTSPRGSMWPTSGTTECSIRAGPPGPITASANPLYLLSPDVLDARRRPHCDSANLLGPRCFHPPHAILRWPCRLPSAAAPWLGPGSLLRRHFLCSQPLCAASQLYPQRLRRTARLRHLSPPSACRAAPRPVSRRRATHPGVHSSVRHSLCRGLAL